MSELNREDLKKIIKQAMREQMPNLLEEFKFEFIEPEWLQSLKTKLETERKEESQTDTCAGCGARVKKRDNYCHDCGEEFED